MQFQDNSNTAVSGNTPLFALHAILLDTETTGLDPRKAKVIEIAASQWSGGNATEGLRTFQTMVDPHETLSAQTKSVTAIDDAMLAGAPEFPAAFAQLREFSGASIIIGHSIGFDIAVFEAECQRAGLPLWKPVTLDTRFLAQAAFPNLPAYTLETVANVCGIELHQRHCALADAQASGRILTALLPHLLKRGVRTLSDALSATKRFTEDGSYPVVWVQPSQKPALTAEDKPVALLDPWLFSTQVSAIMSSPPVFAARTASLMDTAVQMAQAKIGSILVGEAHEPATAIGMLTERDLLRAIAANGASGLDQPVERFASRPLQTVVADAYVYRAAGRMNRLGLRHLAAVDNAGRVTGVISARDLLRSRMSGPVALGDAIDTAQDSVALGRAWSPVPAIAKSLLENGLDGRAIAGVIAREVAALTRRAAKLAEEKLIAEGAGAPPCPYAVLVLGSAGRGESLLSFDQDNALIFERGEPDGAEDKYFARLGAMMNDTLNAVGVPNCPGGVMAKNAPYRGSLDTWRERVRGWIGRSNPQDLLSVDIFFDFRPVHGDLAMAEQFWRTCWESVRARADFLKLLEQSSGESASPFGFLGRLSLDNGRVDLKMHGLKPIVTGARTLALHHGVLERSTAARIAGIRNAAQTHAADLESIEEAHKLILTLIARQQIADLSSGGKAGNKVDYAKLSPATQDDLKAALRAAQLVPDIVRDRLSG